MNVYDLSAVCNFNLDELFHEKNSGIIEQKFKLNHKLWMINDKVYNILKYNKEFISPQSYQWMCLFRSIIYSDNKINVFSPPKSFNIDYFAENNLAEECYAEEFVEGTMINLFYDDKIERWEIASKTTVGAKMNYFEQEKTFNEMFYEICGEMEISFDMLNKKNCYSFVMQHVENRIVIPILENRLYLIAIYRIDGYKISELPLIQIGRILLPYRFKFKSYNDLLNNYGSMNTALNIRGIIIKNDGGERSKIKNPNYEYIKSLKGNSTTLQYQYISLRKVGEVRNYLKYFPEHRAKFSIYRKHIHNFTEAIFLNYQDCFVKKMQKLSAYPKEFKFHMYKLHEYYLLVRTSGAYINKNVVITYVNNLDPAQIMFALNFHLRELSKMDVL